MEIELTNKATDYEKQLFSQYRQTCATCGKQFIRMPDHQYKVRDLRQQETAGFCGFASTAATLSG